MNDEKGYFAIVGRYADWYFNQVPHCIGWGLYYKWKSVKRFFRRCYGWVRYGFPEEDAWDFYTHCSEWVLPRLRHLRCNLNGHPQDMTIEQWEEILDTMIYAFEFVLCEHDILTEKCYPKDYDWGFKSNENGIIWNDNREPDYTYYEECEKRYKLGMKLFSEHFRSLWD